MRYLTVALLLAHLTSSGQGWFADGSVWHYGYYNGNLSGYVRLEVQGDIVINGQTCRKLDQVRTTYSLPSGPTNTQALGYLFVRESAGLVSIYVPETNAFDTLYDMAAVPGDSWRLARLPAWRVCDDESYMQVTDTGTLVLDGVLLRWLAADVHFLPFTPTVYTDTVIERIGTQAFYLLPHDQCNGFLDGAEAGALRCYSDLQIAYSTAPQTPCDFLVGLPGTMAYTALRVFPNPSNGQLVIRGIQDVMSGRIELRDATGRLVRERSWFAGASFDLADLSDGIYAYRILDGSGQVLSMGLWEKR